MVKELVNRYNVLKSNGAVGIWFIELLWWLCLMNSSGNIVILFAITSSLKSRLTERYWELPFTMEKFSAATQRRANSVQTTNGI